MLDFLKVNKLFLLGLLIIIVYLSPLVVFGENSYILIQDTLDQALIRYKILAESGQIFAPLGTIVPSIMNGIPRDTLGSEFNVITWLFYFFPPYVAYVINQFLFRIIGYIGMYKLLSKYFVKDEGAKYINIFCATLFALLPLWPLGGLSVAGMPLVLYAILNIKNGEYKNISNWLILFGVPFYADFELGYVFLMFILGLYWVYELLKFKKVNWIFLLAIIFFTLVSLLVEYRLIYSMFLNNDWISHREEFNKIELYGVTGIMGFLAKTWENFFWEQHHVHTYHQLIILPTVFITLIIGLWRKIDNRIYFLILLIVSCALVYGLWYSKEIIVPLQNTFEIVKSFNFSRFYWLLPLYWYGLFALCLYEVNKFKLGKYVVTFVLFAQIFVLFINSDFVREYNSGAPTFAEFYSTELFSQIKSSINADIDDYKVVSIGIHPAIASYSGFNTLDGNMGSYSLEYKHEFRQIIANELAKNTANQKYFDYFGNRVYILTAELNQDYMTKKDSNIKLTNLELDTNKLKSLGGKYILSAVEIKNYESNGLIFVKLFSDDNSPWQIFLYEVK